MDKLHNDSINSIFKGNFARVYGLMIESIEHTGENQQLATLYQQINNSGHSLALPVALNREIVRTFIRIGVLHEYSDPDYNTKILDYLINAIAQDTDRSPALISVVFRLFACGQYGIISNPVCGSSPQCSKCKLTKYCRFFNSPPADPYQENKSATKKMEQGADTSLSNIELLTILIGGNRPTASSRKAAENICSRFKTLRSLADTSLTELNSLQNVGASAALRIYSALVLYKRFVEESNLDKIVIRQSQDIFELFNIELRDQKQESFYIVMLNSMNGVIKQQKIALGGMTSVQVISREVFRPALKESAVAVVLVHNHPSGNPKPSKDDISLISDLCKAGRLLGVEVVDHIIIGDNRYVSFVDDNISPFKRSKRGIE